MTAAYIMLPALGLLVLRLLSKLSRCRQLRPFDWGLYAYAVSIPLPADQAGVIIVAVLSFGLPFCMLVAASRAAQVRLASRRALAIGGPLTLFALASISWSPAPATETLKALVYASGLYCLVRASALTAEIDWSYIAATAAAIASGILIAAFIGQSLTVAPIDQGRLAVRGGAQGTALGLAPASAIVSMALKPRWMAGIWLGFIAFIMVMTGSRLGLLVFILSLFTWFAISRDGSWSWRQISLARTGLMAIFIGGSLILGPFVGDLAKESQLRVAEPIVALQQGDLTLSSVGTLDWRRRMGLAALNEIVYGPMPQLLVGRGLSAAGQLAGSPTDSGGVTADWNRVVHNEALRIIYELGLIGLGVTLGATAMFYRQFRRRIGIWGLSTPLGIAVCILAIVLVQNPLSSPGTPLGLGLVGLSLIWVRLGRAPGVN